MAKVQLICARCSAPHLKEAGEVNRKSRIGRRFFCSRACAGEARKKSRSAEEVRAENIARDRARYARIKADREAKKAAAEEVRRQSEDPREVERLAWQKRVRRFNDKVIPEPNSGCWLWDGAAVPDGYGSFYWGRPYSIKAHRASWIISNGPIVDGQQVLHRCDNRLCVNPGHLFLGSNDDNVRDRVAKGRSARRVGLDNPWFIDGRSRLRGKPGTPRGERVGGAKLTAAQVVAIRNDPRNCAAIAADHGVSPSNIAQIKRRKVWRHVG